MHAVVPFRLVLGRGIVSVRGERVELVLFGFEVLLLEFRLVVGRLPRARLIFGQCANSQDPSTSCGT